MLKALPLLQAETGAGKSILLDALACVWVTNRCTNRASWCRKTELIALFDINQQAQAQIWLAERDLAQDHECSFTPHCLQRRSAQKHG